MTEKQDPLINDLERAVRRILKDKDASISDRLRAAEIGAKIVIARHRVGAAEGEKPFFGNGVPGHA